MYNLPVTKSSRVGVLHRIGNEECTCTPTLFLAYGVELLHCSVPPLYLCGPIASFTCLCVGKKECTQLVGHMCNEHSASHYKGVSEGTTKGLYNKLQSSFNIGRSEM